jgi:hypothetical protein
MSDLFQASGRANRNGQGSIVATYDYHNEDQDLLYQVVRYDPKDFRQRRPTGNGGWTWNLNGTPRVLYQLAKLLASPSSSPVFVVEGEKDVDRLCTLRLKATCNSGGAGKWKPEYTEHLRNRKVVVIADNDKPGRDHADAIARSLQGIAASVKVLNLPGLPEKGDVSDWLEAGGTKKQLLSLAKEAPEWDHSEQQPLSPKDNDESAAQSKNQVWQLVDTVLAESGLELFRTPEGAAFVSVPIPKCPSVLTYSVRSQSFEKWLRGFAFRNDTIPSDSTITSAIRTLEAKAIHGEHSVHRVSVRIGEDPDGSIWIDLCNDVGEAVHVTSKGWTVEPRSGVKFVRRSGQRPLPHPIRGGKVADLWKFCNVSKKERPLISAYLVASYRPTGPYPVLVLSGEQGSSKTTLMRVVRKIVDPSEAMIRSAPRDERDLMIGAVNSHMIAYDNLSHLSVWLSDGLCRLSTGGAFATRQLYSDQDETLLVATRPCIINGIEELATRSDLMERSLIVELPTIPSELRRTEAEFWAQFELAQSKIFGALLNCVSTGLQRLPEIHLSDLPRLADFAKFAVAAEPATGLPIGSFMIAYKENREGANGLALESYPVGAFVVKLASNGWHGTSSQLLVKLRQMGAGRQDRSFPKNARVLSGILKRLSPNFRVAGVLVEFFRESGGNRDRKISIRLIKPTARSKPKTPRKEGRRTGRKPGRKKV